MKTHELLRDSLTLAAAGVANYAASVRRLQASPGGIATDQREGISEVVEAARKLTAALELLVFTAEGKDPS